MLEDLGKGAGTMAQQESTSRQKIQSGIDELKRLRDEIRQDLRRATRELKDEWRELERKIPDPSTAADQLRGATADVADRVLDELRKFRGRLQRSAGATGGTIGDLMTKPAVTCSLADSLARALSLMWERDIGFLPVIDQEGRLAGTITDRDAAVAATTRGLRLDDLTVDSAMSRQVVSGAITDGPLHALALMKTNQLRRLPVTTEGRPVGVVTVNDLARFSLRSSGQPGGLPVEEIVQALVTIARPRQPNGNPAADID
jgi:CBS domain-containing protein